MAVCLCLTRSILFQRGIYDPESFTKVQKYGLGMQVTTDHGLAEYLKKILTQLGGRGTHEHEREHSGRHPRAGRRLRDGQCWSTHA